MDASVYTISEWAEMLLNARGMPVRNPIGQILGFDLSLRTHGRERPVTELAVSKPTFDIYHADRLRTYLVEKGWPKPLLYVAHTVDETGNKGTSWCVLVGNILATEENLTSMLENLAGLLAEYKN